MDHNEDIDKEISIYLSIFWDIAVQGGNEVMRYLSNSFIYVPHSNIETSLFISVDMSVVGYSFVCLLTRML